MLESIANLDVSLMIIATINTNKTLNKIKKG